MQNFHGTYLYIAILLILNFTLYRSQVEHVITFQVVLKFLCYSLLGTLMLTYFIVINPFAGQSSFYQIREVLPSFGTFLYFEVAEHN